MKHYFVFCRYRNGKGKTFIQKVTHSDFSYVSVSALTRCSEEQACDIKDLMCVGIIQAPERYFCIWNDKGLDRQEAYFALQKHANITLTVEEFNDRYKPYSDGQGGWRRFEFENNDDLAVVNPAEYQRRVWTLISKSDGTFCLVYGKRYDAGRVCYIVSILPLEDCIDSVHVSLD